MLLKNEFTKIFKLIKELQESIGNASGTIKEVNKINLYVSDDGTYFTAKFEAKEYTFHFRQGNNDFSEVQIDEKEELLVLDAFEDMYELIYNTLNKEKIRYEKAVDRLFEAFLKRRKITPTKALLAKVKLQQKTYI